MSSANKDYQTIDLTLLGKLTHLINSTLDIPTLLEVIMDAAKELIGADSASLLFIDDKKQVLNFFVVSGDKGKLIKEISIPIDQGIAGLVARTEEAVIVNDAENDSRIYRAVDETTKNITRNLICVPMKVKDRLVGVLEAINSSTQLEFQQDQLNILSYLADQAAIAINNNDLFRELAKARISLQQRIDELSTLFHFNNMINFSISNEELIGKSVNLIAKALDVRSALFYLYKPRTKEFMLSYSEGLENIPSIAESFKLSSSLRQIFSEHLKPVQIKSKVPESLRSITFLDIEFPILVLPLFSDNNVFALIFLWGRENAKEFSPNDIRIMDNMVTQLSHTYSNIHLHQSLIAQTEVKQELKVARLIQRKILPSTFATPAGVEIQGLNISAEEVGGDFYDFIPIDQHKFALVIGDVAGKGIPASLFMALTRNTIRTEVIQDPNPKNVISKANEVLISDSDSGMFVTVAYFLIDTFNQAVTYVSAGHNNQVLYRGRKQELEVIKGFGKPLGIISSEFEEKVVFYDKGDLLVLYTDGIVEAEDINGEQFEEKRTFDFIKNNHRIPVPDFTKAFEEEVRQFTDGKGFLDDFTMLVTRL